jgi:hypothetical protein
MKNGENEERGEREWGNASDGNNMRGIKKAEMTGGQ